MELTGTTKGLPMYEIIAQSKVMNPIPKPEAYPKRVFTTVLFGAIQHAQLNQLRAVKI